MPNDLPRNLLTIYGRNPVIEALEDNSIDFFKIHLADSNKASPPVKKILDLCQKRGIEIAYHDRMALSRISKNRKQDQGVAADIIAENFQDAEDFFTTHQHYSLIGLENITNPQNLGMIVRAVCTGTVGGLLIPKKGCARIDALVIKASAGTLFKAKIITCDNLQYTLSQAKQRGATVYGLALARSRPIQEVAFSQQNILLLGNETEGLSAATQDLCDHLIHIPMRNNVESLNVAVTAGILAFREIFSPNQIN